MTFGKDPSWQAEMCLNHVKGEKFKLVQGVACLLLSPDRDGRNNGMRDRTALMLRPAARGAA